MKIDIILEPDVTPAQITELGLLAESHGINRIWVQNYSAARDCFLSLVPLALASKRIGIGVMVVSPWEMHPLKMANALLTLNEYSKGRAALCVGGGAEWNGIMAIPITRRVRAVRETTELLKKACGERAVTNYQGEMYKASHFSAAWASDVPPLIYTGAGKEQMIRMSATQGRWHRAQRCGAEVRRYGDGLRPGEPGRPGRIGRAVPRQQLLGVARQG